MRDIRYSVGAPQRRAATWRREKEAVRCMTNQAPHYRQLADWLRERMRSVDPQRLRRELERFPAPRSRLHWPDAMKRADEILLKSFREAGWKSELREFEIENALGFLDYEEDGFPIGSRLKIYPRLNGANVVAVREGTVSRDALLIGAHHDTVRDSPGADDNTASVICLMELARLLSPFQFRRSVMLAAFDMEEINFFGSRILARQLLDERKVLGALVFETMAFTDRRPHSQKLPSGAGLLFPRQARRVRQRRHRGDWTLILHRAASRELARTFARGLSLTAGEQVPMLMRDPTDLPLIGRLLRRSFPVVRNFGRSDHRSFSERQVPALMVTDTAELRNPHYHLPSDTPEKLDYRRLADLVGAAAYTVAREAGLILTA